ncbi:MAG: hypothetical protein ABIM99_06590 [Candidatus Dojkabacteria bacterium]
MEKDNNEATRLSKNSRSLRRRIVENMVKLPAINLQIMQKMQNLERSQKIEDNEKNESNEGNAIQLFSLP